MWTSSASHRPYRTHSFGFLLSYRPVCLILLSQLPLPYTAKGCIRSLHFCVCGVCAHVCMGMCAQRQEDDISILYCSLCLIPLRRDLFLNLEFTFFQLVWQPTTPAFLSPWPQTSAVITSAQGRAWPFYVGTGAQTLVLMVVQQALWIPEMCLQRWLSACMFSFYLIPLQCWLVATLHCAVFQQVCGVC